MTGELLPKPADGSTRVAFVSGTGFSFEIKSARDVERARIIMEIDAQNQPVRKAGRRCEKDAVHLILSWRPGETPTERDVWRKASSDAKHFSSPLSLLLMSRRCASALATSTANR